MADISEVKRSNLAILLNNSRTLWPIDVNFSGAMDMGKKMIPIDFGDNPIQDGRHIGGPKVKFRYFA